MVSWHVPRFGRLRSGHGKSGALAALILLGLFRLTRHGGDGTATTAARQPHDDDAHAHAAREQITFPHGGSEGASDYTEAEAERAREKTLPAEPTAASTAIPMLTNEARGRVVAGRTPDNDGFVAVRGHHAVANDDQQQPRAMAAKAQPIVTDEDRNVNDLTKLEAQMVAAQGGANLASDGDGGGGGGGGDGDPPPKKPPSKAELRKMRLQQLSRLVHKFHSAKREQALLELTAGHDAVLEVQKNRTKALALIGELRTWLRESASIDAARFSGLNVIKVATMVLQKTMKNKNDVAGIANYPLSRIVELTHDESYSRIQRLINATDIRPNTDWVRDPKTWAVWDGAAPTRRRGAATRRRACIVIPFHVGDMGRFPSTFFRWKEIDIGARKQASTMAVIMAYNGDLSGVDGQRMKALLLHLWQLHVAPGGNGPALHFLSLNQPELNHFDGAAISFYQLAAVLPPYFFSMILIETDVNPVAADWFLRLESKTATDCEYWQKGSAAMCDPWYFGEIAPRHDFHINGNAQYVIGCPGLQDYLVMVQKYFPPQSHLKGCCCEVMGGCETYDPNGVELGYDHALYQYRMQPENFDFARQVMSRFRYSPEIYNMCEHSWTDFDDAPIITNETLVVHSKYGLLTREEKLIWRTENEILDRRPGWNELADRFTPVVSGELTQTDMINELCNSQEYQNMRSPNEICERRNGTAVPWSARMPGKVYLWSVDFHSGPSNCNVRLFKQAGAVLHCETDYGLCKNHGMCPRRMEVLSVSDNLGFALKTAEHSEPTELIAAFNATMGATDEYGRVNAFICSHPAANCELFLPFKKPLIVYATTRFEFGRHDKYIDWREPDWNQAEGEVRWQRWLNTTVTLAANPINTIAANNMYDVKYIEYFTGVSPRYIPTWCGGQSDAMQRIKDQKMGLQGDHRTEYAPFLSSVLIGPYRTNLERSRFNKSIYQTVEDHPIVVELHASIGRYNTSKSSKGGPSKRQSSRSTPAAALSASSKGSRSATGGAAGTFQFEFLSSRYSDGYYTTDLAAHPAMVFIPYQVSTIFIHEVYRMNIPMYFPDLDLLTSWWKSHDIMWERMYGAPEQVVAEGLDPRTSWPDPNENSEESFRFWMKWCDWYVLPHVQLFSSWDDLMTKIHTDDLGAISRRMASANKKSEHELLTTWTGIFDRIKAVSTEAKPSRTTRHKSVSRKVPNGRASSKKRG